jgi:cyclic beta-1,2-glucan synthetase
MESILGVRIAGGLLHFDPCIPKTWPGFDVTFRRGSTRFEIRVENPHGVAKGIASARIDGTEIAELPPRLDLPEDGKSHEILVVMG